MLSALEYINYLLHSKKRHGIHSPFIYDLTDRCFLLDIPISDKKKISQFKRMNLVNNHEITITDHGAGSKHMGNKRKIKDIFSNSSSKGKYGKLLYQLANHYKPATILELGTSVGTGTIHMHLGHPNSKIITVEGCPETAKVAQDNFKRSGFDNINLVNDTFEHFLTKSEQVSYDMIFIDGHHDGHALLRYLYLLKPYIQNDTILILDDIRWSRSMSDAWKQIKSDKGYHVTIDLFRMGIILNRDQQVKEHFTLRM